MATTDHTYGGNTLDNYLNITFYNSLPDAMKQAIVDSNITQYSYFGYGGFTPDHVSQADYSTKLVLESGLTRKVYALDEEDIEKYFGGTDTVAGTFSEADLWELFWNSRSEPEGANEVWFRSADRDRPYLALVLHGHHGEITSEWATGTLAARPAFKIDLSKIKWTSNS